MIIKVGTDKEFVEIEVRDEASQDEIDEIINSVLLQPIAKIKDILSKNDMVLGCKLHLETHETQAKFIDKFISDVKDVLDKYELCIDISPEYGVNDRYCGEQIIIRSKAENGDGLYNVYLSAKEFAEAYFSHVAASNNV
jgi:hypothetical protein